MTFFKIAVLGIVMLISCLTITISIIFGVILLKGSNQVRTILF